MLIQESFYRRPLSMILVWCLTMPLSPRASGAEAPPGSPGQAASPSQEASADELARIQEGIRASEYHIAWRQGPALDGVEAAWQAPNRAQGFRIRFTGKGVRLLPRTEPEPSWDLGLALTGYGRGPDVRPIDTAVLAVDKNRIDYARNDLSEWYRNDAAGLKQGFVLEAPPEETASWKDRNQFVPGARRGMDREEHPAPAFLSLTLSGNLVPRVSGDGRAVDFASPDGGIVAVHYAGLAVHDAAGNKIPAWIEGFNDHGVRGIRLVFDDRDAVYPLAVDPLATTAAWSAEGDQGGARFGFAVASAGDINGDGIGDVIVGAPGFADEGRAFVYYGSPSGLETLPAWTADGPNQVGQEFGYSVAGAGDVDDNGCDDVIVGAPGYDCPDDSTPPCTGSYPDTGMVFVYYGQNDGSDCTGLSLTPSWRAWVGGNATSPTGEARFGHAVSAAGNVNNDAYGDVIIGAPGFDNSPVDEDQGAAFVYIGSDAGLPSCGDPSTSACTADDADWMAEADGTGASLGFSVSAAGNVNDDSWDDVIVGAPNWSNGEAEEGAVFVYHGGALGLSPSPDWKAESDLAGAKLGYSVAGAGDLDSSGADDFVAGAPGYSSGEADEGAAFAFYGPGPACSPCLPADADWSVEGDQDGAELGWSVAGAGDIDGDGHDDLLLGAPGFAGVGAIQEGRALLYYGSSGGLGPAYAWSAESDQGGARMGESVAAAGDVNGDTYADVIVGAPYYHRGVADEGQARVFHGAGGIGPAPDELQALAVNLGFSPGVVSAAQWYVASCSSAALGGGCTSSPDNRVETPDAIAYGPIPHSVLLTTGRASDGGLGDTDWLDDGEPDLAVFVMKLDRPASKRAFCFTTQYLTAEYPRDTDGAGFCFARVTPTCTGIRPLSDLAWQEKNEPISHCIDLTGHESVLLQFEVADGNDNGAVDSGLIISRLHFSTLPLSAHDDENGDGYLDNPRPHDVSGMAGPYSYSQTLMSVPGLSKPLELTVSYRSSSSQKGSLGAGWRHNWDALAWKFADGDDTGDDPDTILVRTGSGSAYFKEDTPGVYVPRYEGTYGSVVCNADGSVTYVTKERRAYEFDHAVGSYKLLLTSTTDAKGNEVVLVYDADDRLEQISDTRGTTFGFSYDGADRVESVSTPDSSSVSFTYGAASGRLESFTDLSGYTTRFDYIGAGLVLTCTDGDGVLLVANTYEHYQGLGLDQMGDRRMSHRDGRDADPFDPEAGIRYAYDDESVHTTDRIDRVSSSAFDAKGRVVRSVDLLGVVEEVTYDRNDNPVEIRRQLPGEAAPRVIAGAEYDDGGTLLGRTEFPGICIGGTNQDASCETDADCPDSHCGARTSAEWYPDGNQRSRADHYGAVSRYEHDSGGNRVGETDPLGNQVTHSYEARPCPNDASAQCTVPGPVATTDARGNTYTATYDANGYLTSVTGPLGETVTHNYDALGHRTSTTDPLGNRTCYEYDPGGRLLSQTDQCERCYSGTYDGEPCSDDGDCPGGSCGLRVALTYDAGGRELSRTEADGATYTKAYTPTGALLEETDPLGIRVSYRYDAEDRLVTRIESNPAARATAPYPPSRTGHVYDAGDRMTASFVLDTDGDGTGPEDFYGDGNSVICDAAAFATYDALGNLTSIEDPDGNVTTYTYDLLDRVATETDARDEEVRLAHDARGLVIASTNARGQRVDYTYDAAGRLIGVAYGSEQITHVLDEKGNPVVSQRAGHGPVSREFGARNRLTSRTDRYGNTVGYRYDLGGNLVEITYPSDLNDDGQPDRVLYRYDRLNRLEAVCDWICEPSWCEGANQSDCTAVYGYDNAGNLVQVSLPDGSVVRYTYDAARRLIGIEDAKGFRKNFAAAFTLNDAGRRTSAELTLPIEPQIDPADETFSYAAANRLVDRDGSLYDDDADGNLTAGEIGGSVRTLVYNELHQLEQVNADTYDYDVDGYRVEVTRTGTTRRYVYDVTGEFARLLEEQDAGGNVIARYVHGLGLLSREGAEGIRVYHYDSRGSTVALTDETGAITDRYAYTPYGALAGRTGSTPNPFTYVGRDGVQDDGNGLHYMHLRYYAPELMRFIQKDQVFEGTIEDVRSLNRYAYVAGDPILFTDPNGDLDPFTWFVIGMIIAFVATATVGAIMACADDDGCSPEEVFTIIGESALGAIPVVGTVYESLKNAMNGEWDWVSFGINLGADILDIATLSASASASHAAKTAAKSAYKAAATGAKTATKFAKAWRLLDTAMKIQKMRKAIMNTMTLVSFGAELRKSLRQGRDEPPVSAPLIGRPGWWGGQKRCDGLECGAP